MAYDLTIGEPLPQVPVPAADGPIPPDVARNLQLGTLSEGMRHHLLGALNTYDLVDGGSGVSSANLLEGTAFLTVNSISEYHYRDYYFGDVVTGVQQLSHNLTAALLALQVGGQTGTCTYDRLVHRYIRLGLWLPYGVRLLHCSSASSG